MPMAARPTPKTFEEYIQQLPLWEQQLLEYYTAIEENSELHESYLGGREEELIIGSDGGAYPHGKHKNVGSHGWTIATAELILWQGRGPVLGHPDNCSFRTKAVGMLATLRLLLHLYTSGEIPVPKLKLKSGTNSLSLIITLTTLLRYEQAWSQKYFLGIPLM